MLKSGFFAVEVIPKVLEKESAITKVSKIVLSHYKHTNIGQSASQAVSRSVMISESVNE